MKQHVALITIALLTAIFSCTHPKVVGAEEEGIATSGTQVFTFKDSCQHLVVSLSLELPAGTDSASMQIRDSLIADFILNTCRPGYDEDNTFCLQAYHGDMTDAQAIVDHYGKADYDFLLQQATADYEERMRYVEEDSTMTDEDKAAIRDDTPQWVFDLSIAETVHTQNFIVYQSQAFVYYGGAHGGVAGSGSLTFDRETGKKISRFVRNDATRSLQPMLRRGLLRYYGEYGETLTDGDLSDRLQIDGDIIPLPTNIPCPNATGDSLIFTYQQYEIACYADGMPSFMISLEDLMPYLTTEGKALLSKTASTIAR